MNIIWTANFKEPESYVQLVDQTGGHTLAYTSRNSFQEYDMHAQGMPMKNENSDYEVRKSYFIHKWVTFFWS